MKNFLRWFNDWDWRPLARLLGWAFIASHFFTTRAGLAHTGRELIWSWLLFFDFLIPLFALVLMGGVRLYFVLDDVAYCLAEWIARPIVRRASFAVGFLAAFAVEIVLVRGAVGFWRMEHMETCLLGLLESALRVTCG